MHSNKKNTPVVGEGIIMHSNKKNTPVMLVKNILRFCTQRKEGIQLNEEIWSFKLLLLNVCYCRGGWMGFGA